MFHGIDKNYIVKIIQSSPALPFLWRGEDYNLGSRQLTISGFRFRSYHEM